MPRLRHANEHRECLLSGTLRKSHFSAVKIRLIGRKPGEIVAASVLAAIENEELYIFTHTNMRRFVEARFAAIEAAMDQVKPSRTR